jgi:hypothetical protein
MEHPDNLPRLQESLDEVKNGMTFEKRTAEEKEQIREQINELYEAFLAQFDGVMIAAL